LVAAIATLNEWTLILLMFLFAAIGVVALRRHV
jgi:hypothetical protein